MLPKIDALPTAHSRVDPRFAIFCGDARDVLLECPEQNFSTIVTSPPYWGLRTYGAANEIGSEDSIDSYLGSVVDVLRSARRVLRDDGVMWLVVGDAYTAGHRRYRAHDRKLADRGMCTRPKTPKGLRPKELIGVPWRLAFALQQDGWLLRTDVVWAKPNPLPESVRDRPHRSHEFVFMMTKSPHYFFDEDYFQHPALGVGRFGRSVWNVAVGRRATNHPAAFPVELITPCIISSSRPDDVILDPFCGSGSVGMSCLRVARRFVGVEIVPEYAALAASTLSKLAEQNILRSVK